MCFINPQQLLDMKQVI